MIKNVYVLTVLTAFMFLAVTSFGKETPEEKAKNEENCSKKVKE